MKVLHHRRWRAMLVCFCMLLSACIGQTATAPITGTVQSPLLRALLGASDFTSDWQWLNSNVNVSSPVTMKQTRDNAEA